MKSIACKGHEVRNMLENGSGQLRRVVKLNLEDGDTADCIISSTLDADENGELWCAFGDYAKPADPGGFEMVAQAKFPYGKPGDELVVKEAWACAIGCTKCDAPCEHDVVYYRADQGDLETLLTDIKAWRPSHHMPLSYSRIRLLLKDVRLERSENGKWEWVLDWQVKS